MDAPEGAPRAPEVGVLAMVPNRWTDPWMPRHHVLSRLASWFRVLWMEPAPHWREWLRGQRAGAGARGELEASDRRPPEGLIVYRPGFPPDVHRPERLRAHLRERRVRAAARRLLEAGCRRLVLYVWRPRFAYALEARDFDAVCYHIDDEYTFSDHERPIPAEERRLIERSDQVFIHSPALMEKKGGLNPHTLFLPNGVDFERLAAEHVEPADLSAIPRPRIGYAGWIKKQLDLDLVETLARERAEWSWVLVGGTKPHGEIEEPVRRLRALPNVHFLGPKATEELVAYPAHFDVCIMPYRVDDYTRFINPLKLHECLATGRPVVGSPIPSLLRFRDVVGIAEGAGAWSRALARALGPEETGEARRAARQRVARRHDWGRLVELVALTIAQRVGGRALERVEAAVDPAALEETAEALRSA